MKKIFITLIISLIGINAFSQLTTTCTTDTIKLRANNHQYGTLEWEKSLDNINWTKIQNAHDSIYKFKPITSAYYRVANKFPYCEPIISSVTFVQTKPKANVGKDRIVNDTITYLSGNTMAGVTANWSILEGIGGTIENPNNPSTRFIGFPNGTNGSNGMYKLKYTLQNDCGVSIDTLNVKFVQNQYYSNIVVVDDTDTINSTTTQMENGDYIITFNSPVPTITNQTILIGIVGDGFMRKVTNVSQNGNTFTMTTSQAKFEEVLENGGLEVGQLYNVNPINETLSGRMSNSNRLSNKPTRAELLNNERLKTGTHYFVLDDNVETNLNGVTYSKQNNNSLNRSAQNVSTNENGEEFVLLNFDGTTLYNQSGLTATLDGGLNFTPNFVADIETSLLSLEKLNIGLNNATMSFNSKLTINGTASHDTGNYDFNLLTIHKNLIIVVGGVPFLVKIKTQLNGFLKAVTTGTVNFVNEYEKIYKVNAGLTYNNNTWDKYFNDEVTTTVNNDLTTTAQVTGTLEVGPKLYFTINGIAGPYIDTKMTSDITACVSTQNNQDFNWGVNFDLGAKLTLGVHAYLFKKQLFDKSYTWEKRKMYTEKLPYFMEYISGNNQQYTIGQPLTNPIKVRVLSKQGYYIANVPVTFEVLDNSGSVSETEVMTDSNGFAQTVFTPTANTVSKVQAYVKDCDFNYIQYAPLIFNATQTQAFDCTQTTLSASFYKQGNTLTPFGHLGVLPYTYSTDFYNFSPTQPAINIVAGQNYTAIVKDANGCVAFAHYYQTTNNCADSNLEIDVNVLGTNAVATAQGGTPPYTYSLDSSTTFTTNNTFNNLTAGLHTIAVKDANNCTKTCSINVTNSVSNLVAYFEIPTYIYVGQNFTINNLSTNAINFNWDFGDFGSSNLSNPTYLYNEEGVFTITLTANNGTNQSVYTRTINVIYQENDSCWKDISVGAYHVIAIKNNGTLWAWGRNENGQLGDNSTINKNYPIQIGQSDDWKSVSAGTFFSIGLKNNGSIWVWGDNQNGKLGIPNTNIITVPTELVNFSDSKSIYSNLGIFVIKNNGTLWGWGTNGTILGLGNTNFINTPTQIGIENDWSKIVAGYNHTYGIKNNGNIYCWGNNDFGQLGDGTLTSKSSPILFSLSNNWKTILTKSGTTFGIKKNGTLWAWGSNGGNFGNGSTSYNSAIPLQIGTLNIWNSIHARGSTTFAKRHNGSLWVWGSNDSGAYGNGTSNSTITLIQHNTPINFSKLFSGDYFSVAIDNNGKIWSWGSNFYGQLGTSNYTSSNIPLEILCE